MSSRFRRFVAAAAVAFAAAMGLHAQSAPLDDLLRQSRSYVGKWVPQLANIVAVEEYEQRMTFPVGMSRPLRLRSDVLLVRYPGADVDWMFFRDVAATNGRALDQPPNRLLDLFVNSTAAQQATRISDEALRYNLPGATFAATNPFLAAALMQSYYQPRVRFTLGDIDRSVGPTVRVIRFAEIEEVTEPLNQTVTRHGPMPALLGPAGRVRGSIWVETDTGRIMKTEARIGESASRSTTTTTFARDPRLGLLVPKEMRTTWHYNNAQVNGTARYSTFRRFEVSADTKLLPLSK